MVAGLDGQPYIPLVAWLLCVGRGPYRGNSVRESGVGVGYLGFQVTDYWKLVRSIRGNLLLLFIVANINT